MKNCKWDWVLVAVTFLLPINVMNWAINMNQMSIAENSLMFVFTACWFWYNAMISAHNFIHTPFFKSKVMNQIYMLVSSVNINIPHIMFHFHHMQHHAKNNSLKDPSSTYTYGADGKQEGWFKYSALAPYRKGTIDMFKMSIKKGKSKLLASHIMMIGAYYAVLVGLNDKFLYLYLPMTYVAWFFCSLENYFEHSKATDITNRFANSVSFYGRLYNTIFYNVGFHQEHHLEPQSHWSKGPLIRAKYSEKMQENRTFLSDRPPLLGMFSKRLQEL